MEWATIETAPKDQDIIVWFDHDADPYHVGEKLTNYACHAEGGDFYSGKGVAIARWCKGWYENDGWEAGDAYWMPECWVVQINGDNSDYVCNPTHWMHLPKNPETVGHGLARPKEIREALEMAQEVRDLLLERVQGSPARSFSHNARVRADSLILLLSSMTPSFSSKIEE